jgi:hypothetical protein
MYRGRFSLFLSPKNPHQMRKQANIKMLNFACERNFIELENEKKERKFRLRVPSQAQA